METKLRLIKDITIGYVRLKTNNFISTTLNNKNFLDMLSKFVRVVKISTTTKKYDLRRLQKFNIDYLVVDMGSFGSSQFILREKDNLDIPFIIVLRTIQPWYSFWLNVIPLIRKEDIIIAPSEYAKNSFLRISKKFKVHVVPNCLDVEMVQRRISQKIKRTKKVISFMGRLVKEKGIEILIECIPEIITKVGNVHLNIIGPLSGGSIDNRPKTPFVKQLEKKIKKLKLTKNITFKGLQLGLNKYRLLSESDIFINPTIWRAENIPFSNFEALACGVPIITTNLGGNKKVIKDGECGFIVNVNYDKKGTAQIDRKKLIDSIVKILQDRKLAFRMKQNARNKALCYDFRNVMPKLVRSLRKNKNVGKTNYNGWEILKDKTMIDFKEFYSKEIQFFVNFDTNAHRTYSSIYDRIKRKSPDVKRTKKRKSWVKPETKNRHAKLVNKIRSEFIKYLCDLR